MRQPNFGGPRAPRAQAGFQKVDKQQRATLLRMFGFVMKHYRWAIVVVLVCVLISSITSLISSLFTKTLIDDYIVPLTQVDNPQYQSLEQTLFKLALVLFFGTVCSYTYNRLMIHISQGTMLRLRKTIFEKMQHLPINYFDQRSHGDIMSVYTNDVDSLRQMISTAMAQVFSSVITIVATFTSMIVMNIPLTLVSVVMAVVMAVTTTQLGKRSRNFFRTQQQRLASVNGFIEEMLTGQKVIKIFCHEEQAIKEFEEINEQLRTSACNANRIANIVMPVNGGISNFGFMLLAVVGATLAIYDFGIYDFCGNANHGDAGRQNIFDNHSAGANPHIVSDPDAADNLGILTNVNVVADNRGVVGISAVAADAAVSVDDAAFADSCFGIHDDGPEVL